MGKPEIRHLLLQELIDVGFTPEQAEILMRLADEEGKKMKEARESLDSE